MPSVSQKQADMWDHAAHSPEYAAERKLSQAVAQGFNGEDIRSGEWGKGEDTVCGKIVKDAEGNELPPCEFSGPRPWAAEAPDPPPVEEDEDRA